MATRKSDGFTAEERAAMKERAAELRAEKAGKKAGEKAAADLARGARQDRRAARGDRELAEGLHAIITAAAPDLAPRTWYGMPAHAQDGKVLAFVQPGSKLGTR